MKTLTCPPLLKTGDKAALIAPASPVSADALKRSILSLKFLGLEPVVMPSCKASCGYLSGEDRIRAADINRAFADDKIKAVFCLRGGYGSMRLLPSIDYEMISQNPKFFVGYSDITALHTAINRLSGLITFHGPMPGEDYTSLDDFTLASLKRFLFSPDTVKRLINPDDQEMETLRSGSASGILTGGNLSMICATLGSPYEIDTADKILFIEEVNEPAYKIDRSLISLALAGKLRDCAGIILGTFAGCGKPDGEYDSVSLSVREVINEVVVKYEKPTILNIRAGHTYPQITLPLGAKVQLNAAENSSAKISVL